MAKFDNLECSDCGARKKYSKECEIHYCPFCDEDFSNDLDSFSIPSEKVE